MPAPDVRRKDLLPRRANLRPDAPLAKTVHRHLQQDYRLRYDASMNGSGAWVEPETGFRFSHAQVEEHPDTALLARLSPAQWRALTVPGMHALVRSPGLLRTSRGTAARTLQSLVTLGLIDQGAWASADRNPAGYLTERGQVIAKLVATHERAVDHLEQGPAVINR